MDLQFSTESSYKYEKQTTVCATKKHATITETEIVSGEERIAKRARLDTMMFARIEQKTTKLHREKRVTTKDINRVNIYDSWMQKYNEMQSNWRGFFDNFFQIKERKRCVSTFSATIQISSSVTAVFSDCQTPRIKKEILSDKNRLLSSKRKHIDVDANDCGK